MLVHRQRHWTKIKHALAIAGKTVQPLSLWTLFVSMFIHLKLEVLKQFPTSNDEKNLCLWELDTSQAFSDTSQIIKFTKHPS